MRYAIVALVQIVIASGYITAYNWEWLLGSNPIGVPISAGTAVAPSNALWDIGLAVAAVLTLPCSS